MHTENSHLCEIITNFAGGVSALNGLTANTQYFATGTSGTDFAISSATDTHTFNLPTASATNRGALSSADWSTFSGKVGGSGTTGQVAYWNGTSSQTGSNNLFWNNANANLGIGSNAVNSVWKLGVDGNVALTGSLSLGPITGSGSNAFLEVTASQFRIYAHTSRYLSFSANATEYARLQTTGNFILGSTFTDGGQRLQVQGDVFIKGSGATDSTFGLTVQNSAGTNLLRFRNDGYFFINGSGILNGRLDIDSDFRGIMAASSRTAVGRTSNGTTTLFYNGLQLLTGNAAWSFNTDAGYNLTTGSAVGLSIKNQFTPTSGTAEFTHLALTPTINQTGGANGITRGIHIASTLTAAADWRSIEWSNNSGWGLYGAGTANNYLGGDTAIGTATLGTATKLTIGGSETASGGIARGELNNATLVASANNDILVGLDVNPTFTNGAFTGVTNLSARFTNNVNALNGVQILNNNNGGFAVSALGLNSDIANYTLFSYGSGRANTGSNQFNNGASALLDYQGSGSLNIASTFATGTNSGIRFWTAASTINGTEKMRLTAAGRLLLGTTTESTFLLDVNGTARVSGAITAQLSDNAGSNNNLLVQTVNGDSAILRVQNNEGGVNISTNNGVHNFTDTATAISIQTGNVGVRIASGSGGVGPAASAMLDVISTTRGFLPPRMTTTQKNAISSPAAGLIVYDTDTNKLCCYNGTSWNDLF
jgi:hypothetical protein